MPSPVTFLSTLSACEHLPNRLSRRRYVLDPHISPNDYLIRLKDGWRRFGPFVFRQECPSCRMCQSLRVPAATFRPSESQRRAWKRNTHDLTMTIGLPAASAERLALLRKFHRHGHLTKGWPAEVENQMDLFLANPFPTEEWSYRLGERLIGVGYVDALAEGLSAIYFYWDPAERHRSLGTFNIMAMMSAARERGLPYVYLGYFVEGCRSLEYKSRFRPNEVLSDGGAWIPFTP
jgi:arginine-tRNA-protein transferase